jgi:hypothetical protein
MLLRNRDDEVDEASSPQGGDLPALARRSGVAELLPKEADHLVAKASPEVSRIESQEAPIDPLVAIHGFSSWIQRCAPATRTSM